MMQWKSGRGQRIVAHAIDGRCRPELTKTYPQHADSTEREVRSKPVKRLGGGARLQGNPAKTETKKYAGKHNREHSRPGQQPFIRNTAADGSCSSQCIHAE